MHATETITQMHALRLAAWGDAESIGQFQARLMGNGLADDLGEFNAALAAFGLSMNGSL